MYFYKKKYLIWKKPNLGFLLKIIQKQINLKKKRDKTS